jgi:hypothetical protein
VVVGELYAALPDVLVKVGHEALEVFFGAVGPYGKDGGPAQFVDEDEEDVRFRSWFGDALRETKATGDTGACDGGGGFQEVSAFHCLFSNGRNALVVRVNFGEARRRYRTHTGDNWEFAQWLT